MSNLDQLLELYTKSSLLAQLTSKTAVGSKSVHLVNHAGSLPAVIIAALRKKTNSQSILFIASNKEEAAYYLNSFQNLLPNHNTLFLPDSFKRPNLFEEINPSQILERTETVNKISTFKTFGFLLVTYPEALLETVVSPDALSKSRISLKKEETIDVDSLTEILVEYGFVREDFVYEPGQFSIRGGIVDIFSFGNEYPYRVELMDEEIESIRTFDPLSQRSIQNISLVSIVPNVSTSFSEAEKNPLLDILEDQTIVCVANYSMLIDNLQTSFEKKDAHLQQLHRLENQSDAEFFKKNNFTTPGVIATSLNDFSKVFLADPPPKTLKFEWKGSPQKSFNKNFNLLIENFIENNQKGYSNFLFAENPRQIERFYSIFEDLKVDIDFHPIPASIHEGFTDPTLKIACFTDHQIFERFHRYQLKKGFSKDQALNLKMIRELQPGDFVTHIDHGVGKFSGLQKIDINGHLQEAVRLVYKNNDMLYVSINSLHKISKYVGKEGTEPALSKLGSDAWKTLKRKTKAKVKDIAGELIKLYAARKAASGFAFPADNYLQNELEASFIYEDTPDQLKATLDVKEDMIKPHPMDRLVCGDVGFGKTEVAIRAAFKAILGGKQVAVLVPTTILALQHFKTFKERLNPFGTNVDFINRFRSTSEKNVIYKKLKSGEIDLVIGTHGLLNQKIEFKDLGLLIIDEEQKFGVAAKEKLRNLKINVDTLTLTATPIPRTLQFSLMAARDLSIIRTPPPNRQPIHTESRVFSEELIKEAIYYEIQRGGQVFFVHNRVKNLGDFAAMVSKLCPDVSIAVAHGQMDAKFLEKTLVDFIEKKLDVLISTNIIETGLDIPNANTIIINNAHQFGLSDLHQLRGRVGRSNTKAFCYLISPPLSVLTADARKRLKTLEEFTELGSGFNIAMRDLDIRGAGNLLGAEQSGFIADIGYDTFQKILEEAIQELKETDFKDLFKDELSKKTHYVKEVQIDADVEMLIPDDYVSNIQERLSLYTQLDQIEDDSTLKEFKEEIKDRFGTIPPQLFQLFDGIMMRKVAKDLGFERIILKNHKLRCYFVENPQSPYYESSTFQKLLTWISVNGTQYGLTIKKSPKNLILVKDRVRSLAEARQVLEQIKNRYDIGLPTNSQ